MPDRFRRVLSLMLAGLILVTASCGTLFHPERVGQPRGGKLDLSIVLLDGLGLLFFFVPGVIAFIVDFATGAIYLPPGYGDNSDPKHWRVVTIPKEEMTRERIEEVVAREVGMPVDLDGDGVQVERLQTIDEAPQAFQTFDAAR